MLFNGKENLREKIRRIIGFLDAVRRETYVWERYIKVSWPEGVCKFIKICLDHGGYAVSFYPIPGKPGVVQVRCLQHKYAVERWGKVESVVVEDVPHEWYEKMRREIGEWKTIWREVCKGRIENEENKNY